VSRNEPLYKSSVILSRIAHQIANIALKNGNYLDSPVMFLILLEKSLNVET